MTMEPTAEPEVTAYTRAWPMFWWQLLLWVPVFSIMPPILRGHLEQIPSGFWPAIPIAVLGAWWGRSRVSLDLDGVRAERIGYAWPGARWYLSMDDVADLEVKGFGPFKRLMISPKPGLRPRSHPRWLGWRGKICLPLGSGADSGGPPEPPFTVQARWKEELVYREGGEEFVFDRVGGVTPGVAYVPSAAEWDRIVPAGMRGSARRAEIIERLRTLGEHDVQEGDYSTPLLCRDLYQGGCDRPIGGPAWLHRYEFHDGDGRPMDPSVRRDLSEDLLRMLATSTAASVRAAIFSYPIVIPEDLVDSLLTDPAESVHKRALGATRSVAALREAEADTWTPEPRYGEYAWIVRNIVAANECCPPDLIDKLSRDPHPEVRAAAFRNPHCPQNLIDAGVTDPDSRTRRTALGRTTRVEHLRAAATSPQHEIRLEVATHPDCPPEVIEALAVDAHPDVRGFLATNPACPDDLVRRLAGDQEAFVVNMARRELDRRGLA